MKTTQREISTITPYEKNPRLNDDAVETPTARPARTRTCRVLRIGGSGWRHRAWLFL